MRELFVFSSIRQIRNFTQNFSNQLLPKAISIGDFFSKAVYVDGLNEAGQSECLIYMRDACNACKNANLKLHIPTEFFAFLKNNDYLFSFFKEITHQKKSILALKFSDIYAHFDEHIEILNEVFKNYKEILIKNSLYDNIILPEVYEINEAFLKAYERINIQIDGLLSEFEWEVLLRAAKFSNVKIIFKTSKLNQKLLRKISEILASDTDKFELYCTYELDLNTLLLTKKQNNAQNRSVLVRAFSLSSLQAAFVFEKISTFMREGIEPERIAVILPDENFARVLRLYDRDKMLSFAMGNSVKDSLFYAILSNIVDILKEQKTPCLKDDYFELKNRNLRCDESFLNINSIDSEIFELFRQNFEKYSSFELFYSAINALLLKINDEKLSQILHEELFFLQNLSTHARLKFSELCEFLLLRLSAVSIDDVGGGAVRVMGVLESRGLAYDGVIIVDFNDDLVPKRSVNEMFLSSKVREKAGLISYFERENLQRFYYECLIGSAKKVAISYVSDESRIESRFLSEFSCIADKNYDDDAYFRLFLRDAPYVKTAKFISEHINVKHDFFEKPLSFSRLDTFLTCPRKYFYRYIKELSDERFLDEAGASGYGNAVHEALFEYYKKHEKFMLEPFMQILSTKDLDALELEISKQKFKIFETNENDRFASGWHVKECEVEKNGEFCGVKLEGKIDRIDVNDDGRLCVIDYKTGKIVTDSLQLLFYKALLSAECECYFYDLKSEMKLIIPKNTDLSELSDKLKEVRDYFSKHIDLEPKVGAACEYCAYYAICTGDIA
ncbi:PD-(D/E)XK nuclease family protein [Campylobacter sp. 9BO]|uniref:RecB family exonuclease n=1 Tax=Campylobacter sp. 9BO TaxID=3424759 RepID=UPI003D3507E4